MLASSKAFSSFSVDHVARAHHFYGAVLGLPVSVENDLLHIELGAGRAIAYPKRDHEAAKFTILNFPVPDIRAAVDELVQREVEFERYDGFEQDERGIHTGGGPLIAWFKDPAGNIISLLEE